METIDGITGKVTHSRVFRYIAEVVNGILIYGNTSKVEELRSVIVVAEGRKTSAFCDPKSVKNITWSPFIGDYVLIVDDHCPDATHVKYGLNPNLYPYTFQKKYEAVQHFNLFKDKQVKIEDYDFPIAKYVTRTIGIEFETSLGAISEEDCLKYGLIPLRDGSITGVEYSTVILQGNSGFNLLKKQLDLLRQNTFFNKDCSLHIHFGDYPLDPKLIYKLQALLYNIQNEIQCYIPRYSFYTEKYKSNGKAYCKPLASYSSFSDFFVALTGTPFLGSFTQPHPNDITREHKWNVPTRYYWCNFINLLCYNVNKTVEFRFLRPTYNLEKILTWIYILNGFLEYASRGLRTIRVDIRTVLSTVYPKEVFEFLCVQLDKLNCLRDMQCDNLDYIGEDITLENRLFDDNKII